MPKGPTRAQLIAELQELRLAVNNAPPPPSAPADVLSPADDDGEDQAAAIMTTIDQLESTGGVYMHVYAKEGGKVAYVGNYEPVGFDLADFAKQVGRGSYEFRFYVRGQSGCKKRVTFDVHRSVAPTAATPAAPTVSPQSELLEKILLAQIANQGQLMTALVSSHGQGGGGLDSKLLVELLTKRSPIEDIKSVIEITRGLQGAEDKGGGPAATGASILDVLNTGIQAITNPNVGNLIRLVTTPTPGQSPNLNLAGNRPQTPHNASVPATPSGPAIPSSPAQPASPAQNAQTALPASDAPPPPLPPLPPPPTATDAPPPPIDEAARTQAQAQSNLLDLLTRVLNDPQPMPLVYAAELLRIFGPEGVTKALVGQDEGVLATQLIHMVPSLAAKRDLIDEVEDILRDQVDPLDDDEDDDPVAGKIEPAAPEPRGAA